MKLLFNGKVYIQRIDLLALIGTPIELPESFIKESVTKYSGVHLVTGKDLYSFDCEFSEQENVDWLLDQDWILDYDEYRSASVQTIRDKMYNLDNQCSDMCEKWQNASEENKQNEFDTIAENVFYNDYQIDTLELLLSYRDGKCIFTFPRGYEPNRIVLLS